MPGPMLFEPISIRDVTLKNRVVVAPMHQYSAVKGFATDWHLMNAGRYAAGGAGLVIMESTKVERRGCGTVGDLGLWDDAFIPGLKRCVDFIRQHNAVPGIQLGHSGRKARRFRPWEGGAPLKPSPEIDDWDGWELVSSSAHQCAGDRSDAARADARRDPEGDRALGPGGAARARGGLRRARYPWRARLPDPPVPLAVLQRAQRRVRRQRAQPHALLHRGGRKRARALAGRQAAVPAPLGRGRCRLGARPERGAGEDREAQGRRRDRLQLGRHARLAGGERRAGDLRLSGALCRAAAQAMPAS